MATSSTSLVTVRSVALERRYDPAFGDRLITMLGAEHLVTHRRTPTLLTIDRRRFDGHLQAHTRGVRRTADELRKLDERAIHVPQDNDSKVTDLEHFLDLSRHATKDGTPGDVTQGRSHGPTCSDTGSEGET